MDAGFKDMIERTAKHYLKDLTFDQCVYIFRGVVMGAIISVSLYYILRLLGFQTSSAATKQIQPESIATLLGPLPKVRNINLNADMIGDRDIFVIGDVHGCYDELVLLLKKARVTDETIVIFVGDMIDKGPKNIQVLELIKKLGAYAVRGNHESKVLRNLEGLKNDPQHRISHSLRGWIHDLSQEQKDYLISLPYSITIPSLSVIIVHAGLVPGVMLHEQHPNDVTNMRNLVKNESGFTASMSGTVGEAWVKYWGGPEFVYFGHDAQRRLQVEPFCMGLDTGCVYGGQLTGVYITGNKQLYTVDAIETYKKPGQ